MSTTRLNPVRSDITTRQLTAGKKPRWPLKVLSRASTCAHTEAEATTGDPQQPSPGQEHCGQNSVLTGAPPAAGTRLPTLPIPTSAGALQATGNAGGAPRLSSPPLDLGNGEEIISLLSNARTQSTFDSNRSQGSQRTSGGKWPLC